MLLSTAYFPPIEFFALLAENSVVYMEAHEHYCKQSWRNRCMILSANGPMALNYPVKHQGDIFHTPITEIMVDYSVPWVHRTEYAIESAYSASPFFEYYKDELFAILDAQPQRLWDLNMNIIEFFCRKIGIAPDIRPTMEYVAEPDMPDYRQIIHPKRENNILAEMSLAKPYWQVFREKFGFVPGMSIMDLLFNEGPESICWL